MQIDDKTLPSLKDFEVFKITFENYAAEVTRGALLKPVFSLPRLRDAHYAWLGDLKRLGETEDHLKDGPDHSKQCGHLAYWLRRQNPIVEYEDWHVSQEDPYIYPDEEKKRDFITRYGSEFLAFDFGFQICSYYAQERLDKSKTDMPRISMEYLTNICHMLKFKHVSPHALYLIYESLFL
jgi:hypothetical protein